MKQEFKREERYIVIKHSDLQKANITGAQLASFWKLCTKVMAARKDAGKPPLECLVVEKDWPEYEPTWKAIEERMK